MSFDSAKAFLREHGAEAIEHPGGTLYAHLCRVADRLAELGAGPDLQLAGLTHAAYGTDGFARALLEITARDRLRAVIGPAAETLVYLYGACDRDRTWPVLAETATVHDRFTGSAVRLDGAQLMPFVDLSVVNKIDVLEHQPALLAEHGPYFHDLFDRWALVTSPDVADEAQRILAGI
ncbi:hypothetical protein ACTOB_004574 [Actinoplanes oblitus]|uniref:DUF6817 domain-containing protein n=1 Tax=Actinoplanes oblitus TaxID=3040509 RepID=A0ABY8W6H1_9ACTN|nr:hypothetical protein [Actinoplanes oblitus]WIM92622.1 hypothetical protein ACTOB_004574 [Actinoplanes oblitus]